MFVLIVSGGDGAMVQVQLQFLCVVICPRLHGTRQPKTNYINAFLCIYLSNNRAIAKCGGLGIGHRCTLSNVMRQARSKMSNAT
jgi:hypothetical protein